MLHCMVDFFMHAYFIKNAESKDLYTANLIFSSITKFFSS
jgi:hypothetical protein